MSVRRNIGTMGWASLVTFILNFIAVVTVSRLLTPMEVGIYSVSVAVLGIAHIFRDFGVVQYLVQAKNVSDLDFRAAFSVTLLSSWLIAFTIFIFKDYLAVIYGHEGVSEVLSILFINFIILPFGTPILAIIQRELKFNYLATNMWLTALVQTLVTIICAFMGQSYLSMAWGALASYIVKIVWLNYIYPGRVFFMPTFSGISKVCKFGTVTSLTSIISEIGSGAPDLILGRTLGFVEVAFFSRAYGLKKMLVTTLFRIIRTVYFPTFAKEIRDGKKAAELYSESMVYIVAVMGPMLAFVGVVSAPLIIFLFGEQWVRSAPLASLICFYAALSTPFSLYNVSLVASGKVVTNFVLESTVQLVQIAVLLSSFWLDLELVVSLFIFVSLVQVVGAYIALRKEFGLSLFLHLRTISTTILLIPLSVAGPVLVIFNKSLFYSEIYVLICAGLLWLVGWLLGVFLFKHPFAAEVRRIVVFFIGSHSNFIRKL